MRRAGPARRLRVGVFRSSAFHASDDPIETSKAIDPNPDPTYTLRRLPGQEGPARRLGFPRFGTIRVAAPCRLLYFRLASPSAHGQTYTSNSMEFLEKIGDFFIALTAAIERLVTRLFGASNERMMRRLGFVRKGTETTIVLGSLLDTINQLEACWEKLSDDELRQTASK